jgi:competence protein ComEA
MKSFLKGLCLVLALMGTTGIVVAKDSVTTPINKAEFANKVVNLNKADANTLRYYLKGIGEVKADAIIQFRKNNGKFSSVNDLLKVPGIGEATFKGLKKNVSTSKGETTAPKLPVSGTASKSKSSNSSSKTSKSADKEDSKKTSKTAKKDDDSKSKSKADKDNSSDTKKAKAGKKSTSKTDAKKTAKSKTDKKAKKSSTKAAKCDPKKDKACKPKATKKKATAKKTKAKTKPKAKKATSKSKAKKKKKETK